MLYIVFARTFSAIAAVVPFLKSLVGTRSAT